jgi:hypothetical protein
MEAKVEEHLSRCDACREEWEFYINIKEAATELENVPPPAYMWDRIELAIDEHPWGEKPESRKKTRGLVWGVLGGRVNYVAAALSLILIFALSLAPNSAYEKRATQMEPAGTGDLEYVSLYMMTNQNRFPVEIRDYYLAGMEGLNQKIKTIKSALERFPENRHIKAQLALAYKQKIDLYRELGTPTAGGGGNLPGSVTGESISRGGCYE